MRWRIRVPIAATCVVVSVACGATERSRDSNPVRSMEDAIKARSARTQPKDRALELESERPVLTSREEPLIADVVNVESLTETSLLLVDNLNSRILRCGLETPKPTVERWSGTEVKLAYPLAIRRDRDLVHIWDNDGVATLDAAGALSRRHRTFFGAHDFLVVQDGFVINPNDRRVGSPLLVGLDPGMNFLASWGEKASGALGHARARALLASLGTQVVAGFVHQPVVRVFGRHSTADVSFSFPGLEELAELERDMDLVSPSRGVVRLPTYIAGVCALGGRVYVLLDLPRVHILQIGSSGRVEATYVGRSIRDGRHYSRLVGVETHESLRLYSLAFEPDRTRVLMGMTIPASRR